MICQTYSWALSSLAVFTVNLIGVLVLIKFGTFAVVSRLEGECLADTVTFLRVFKSNEQHALGQNS